MSAGDEHKGPASKTDGLAARAAGMEVGALLARALVHHRGGEFARARALYEQILSVEPRHADTLQYLGILSDQCGDAPRAEKLIRRAIAVRGDLAPYHDNLGTVLEHRGRFDAALSAYLEAERLEPGLAERALNLGIVLERLGRAEQAESRYREAIARNPQDIDCHFALAKLLAAQGDLPAAIRAYRHLLNIDAGHLDARVGLGNALQDDEQFGAALDEYRTVIARAPDHSAAWHNQGRALLRTQRLAEAQAAFESALRHEPRLTEARLGLAQVLEQRGLFTRAYAAYRALCASAAGAEDEQRNDSRACAGLLRVARVLPPRQVDELLVAQLLSAIDAGEVSATSYARTLGVQLAAKAGLYDAAPEDDADALRRAISLESDALFAMALQRCVNVVPEVERWLCAVRRALLHASAGQLLGREPLLCALALQCAENEYVFAVTDDEVGVIDAVLAQLEPQTASSLLSSEHGVCDLLLCACYLSLRELWGVVSLVAADADADGGDAGPPGPWLAPVLERTVLEPLSEQAIAADLETLAPIDDPSSARVREQYEEHPYPRWRELTGAGAAALVRGQGQGQGQNQDSDGSGAWMEGALAGSSEASILVAGCGTGHEPLMLARRYPDHAVLAMDLSRASLAYAARMAAALDIETVRFMQGDLLDVKALDRQFAVITASGVLHHMADPLAGWRALAQCLEPRGIMKVSLYSRRARATVNAARERVTALGLAASAEGVRALRARVLAGDEPQLQSLLDSEDFYTTSMCRDLIFHPLEHQFDLREIATMLESVGLQFVGFELPHPLIRRQFLAAQLGEEADLAAWDRFEEAHPQTFEAMYVMWCRKINPADGACRS